MTVEQKIIATITKRSFYYFKSADLFGIYRYANGTKDIKTSLTLLLVVFYNLSEI